MYSIRIQTRLDELSNDKLRDASALPPKAEFTGLEQYWTAVGIFYNLVMHLLFLSSNGLARQGNRQIAACAKVPSLYFHSTSTMRLPLEKRVIQV